MLADCLAHAIDQGADRLVDVATLTGAIVTTFGSTYAGLFGTDDGWCAEVEAAGRRAGELVWRLPFHAEYADLIKGRYADIANAVEARKAGSITAAEFLKRFTGDTPWVHLDIAGMAVGQRQAVHAQGRRRLRRAAADRARARERGRARHALRSLDLTHSRGTLHSRSAGAAEGAGAMWWGRVAVTVTVFAALGAAASGAQAAPRIQGENATLGDVDARHGRAAPSASQRRVAARGGLRATWNRFGTPRSLAASDGYLARGLAADPVVAARGWIAGNLAVLGIDAAAARNLELVSAAPIGAGRAVLLRQRFGALPAGRDGVIVVGVAGGKVAYVSSSLTTDTTVTGALRLDAGRCRACRGAPTPG